MNKTASSSRSLGITAGGARCITEPSALGLALEAGDAEVDVDVDVEVEYSEACGGLEGIIEAPKTSITRRLDEIGRRVCVVEMVDCGKSDGTETEVGTVMVGL
jgi:hypothetical protein